MQSKLRPILHPHEWKFDGVQSLPNDQVEACYQYEYARQFFKGCAVLQGLRKRWEKPRKKASGDGLMAWLQAYDLLKTKHECFPPIFFDFFPMTPWQGLPEDFRRKESVTVNECSRRLRQHPADRLHIETQRQLDPPNIKSPDAFQFYHEFRRKNLDQTEYGFFAIDWNYSDPEISRAFDHWLKGQRKERAKLGLSKTKPAKGSRGGFRDKLRWLGALRVKEHYSPAELVDYPDTNLKVDSPYSHLPDLYENAQRAIQLMGQIFPSEWSEADWKRRQKEQDETWQKHLDANGGLIGLGVEL